MENTRKAGHKLPGMFNVFAWDAPSDVEELKAILCGLGYDEAIVFDPDFAPAAIGVSEEGRVVYDYELMVESLVSEGMTYDDAVEFIDYNTIRSLPYIGPNAPIVMKRFTTY